MGWSDADAAGADADANDADADANDADADANTDADRPPNDIQKDLQIETLTFTFC